MTDDAGLLEVADELYALALGDFTAARDAKAKALKSADAADLTELAAPVKALRKPSVAAWVVNLFVRREGDQADQVLAMGAALREAQAEMSADELRSLTRQRRQLTAAITQQARSLALEEGVKVTSAVAEQVEATFTAAMVSQACGRAVRSGLLVAALSTTGVDDVDPSVSVAVPTALGFTATPRTAQAVPRPELHVVPDPDAEAKARAAAEEALAEAERDVVAAQADHDDAAAAVQRLEARQLQVQAEIDELKRKVAELESAHDEVDDDLGDAEDARAEAEEALDVATASRDQAASLLASRG